jgi:hypothetical protein
MSHNVPAVYEVLDAGQAKIMANPFLPDIIYAGAQNLAMTKPYKGRIARLRFFEPKEPS